MLSSCSFTPHKTKRGKYDSPHYIEEEIGSRRLSSLLEVTQLVRSGMMIQPQMTRPSWEGVWERKTFPFCALVEPTEFPDLYRVGTGTLA